MDPRHFPSQSNDDDQPTVVGPVFAPGHKVAGRYLIQQSIGRGAFGQVYRAQDEMLGRSVALKTVIFEGPGSTPAAVQQFLDEARTIAQLDHSHIVPVYDAGIEQAVPWMTMRLIEGQGLDDLLRREGRFPANRAVHFLKQAAAALDHAHRKGIVHRDIKPSNLLVERRDDGSEHLWLADFGIARVLSGKTSGWDGVIAGTPSYMSPEQITGKKVDARTDIFALGCIAFELVTGRRAFSGETYSQVLYKIVHEQPEGLNEIASLAGAQFESIVRRALSRSPEDRYQTVQEIAADLENVTRPDHGGSAKRLGRAKPVHWDGRMILTVEDLHKSYSKTAHVLKGVSLNVSTGSIYACLGRNGSGKTTLIRTFMGIYRPDEGSVAVFGRDPQEDGPAILARIGYVPETITAYEWLRVSDFIEFMKNFYPRWDNSYCLRLLARYDLTMDKKIRDLSKGMKTKVGVVCALSHRPEFLVLDDPTLGLDAVVLEEVFETLGEVSKQDGTTIFISSHNLEEIEKIASHVGFMTDGKLMISDTLQGLKMRTREVKLTFRDDIPDLAHIEKFKTVRSSGRRLTGVVLDTSSGVIERLKALDPEQIEVRELSLKEIFVNFMR
jgi:serine/threonine-protein kinase